MAWNKQSQGDSALDMKGVLVQTNSRIGSRIYAVSMSNDNPTLRGWISEIKIFEKQMIVYIDEKYYAEKKKCLDKLKGEKPPSREQVMDVWIEIYGLLCQKMTAYGAYPLTPFEEVQEHDHPEYIFEDDEMELLD